MNLPNAMTVGRIVLTPLIAWLPFATTWGMRLLAFGLFLVAAISDYWDGRLARTRNSVTDLGRLLDPLADKLLLAATLLPMYLMQRHVRLFVPLHSMPEPSAYLFETPFFRVALPLWIVLIVLGREVIMTAFRQYAARRGLVIAAIGPAKWKMAFQFMWIGAAYFWFFAYTLAKHQHWLDTTAFRAFAIFNGLFGVLSMLGAVGLTLYSLWLYLRRYGSQVLRPAEIRS